MRPSTEERAQDPAPPDAAAEKDIAAERAAVRARCSRFLSHHHARRAAPRQAFIELAEASPPDLTPDAYGDGEIIQRFEREVAVILGKEQAIFVPSGIMAQQIALRIWADRAGRRSIAWHPTCHLETHEERGHEHLHNLHGVLVGSPHRLLTLGELKKVREPLGALLIELPQRPIGGQLPTWDELVEIAGWARSSGVRLHMDGARLWEIKPFYQRDYAEIAGLFDSVYVSFYKGLGGIAGAALAGPSSFIDEARVWRRRHGGTLVQMYPYVISARAAMAERLERMDLYYKKAVEIAEHLATIEGLEIVPNPPQTNMMHLYLRGERGRLEAAALDIARSEGFWLFGALSPSSLPSYWKLELVVGDATMDLDSAEIAATFKALLERAAD